MLRENKNLTFAGHYISQDGKETRKSYLGWHNPTTYRIVQELKVAYRVDSCHSHQQQEQKHQLCLCHIEIHVWKTNYFSIQSLYVYLWSIILLLLKKNMFLVSAFCLVFCCLCSGRQPIASSYLIPPAQEAWLYFRYSRTQEKLAHEEIE